jgi:NAD(P)-dependent dehydrogenase (short-subunit alcohol dehydrogenase family)
VRLDGKVVVITGAARGLGHECAFLFSAEGAKLVLTDIDGVQVKATADEVRGLGHEVVSLEADVSRLEDHEAAVQAAVSNFGRLDVYYNNAGIAPPGRPDIIPYEEIAEELVRRNVAVNLLGAMFAAQASARQMKVQGAGGAILFSSSAAAFVGVPNSAVYGACKAGVNGLVRSLAVDLGPYGIRVNCIAPLYGMNANFTQPGAQPNSSYEQGREWRAHESPAPLQVPYAPTLRDNALAALFLASDEARWMSGVCLPTADGGTLSRLARSEIRLPLPASD